VAKNEAAKTRPVKDPYEVWMGVGSYIGWEWLVLKKYQADDDKPYARAFCMVYSPYVPNGELGDVYISDYKSSARRVQ
jgi:hypothetical protein